MEKITYFPKEGDQKPAWVVIDLEGIILGRAATRIANVLRGKSKATYTPHVDMGDFVVAINADKVKLTGNKWAGKKYYHHTGYPGGIRETSAGDLLEKKPEELIRLAVSGMLPKNKLRKHFLKKLKVYTGAEHPHSAQNPQTLSLNDKG
jgi:large subunit ribosomal protein L13